MAHQNRYSVRWISDWVQRRLIALLGLLQSILGRGPPPEADTPEERRSHRTTGGDGGRSYYRVELRTPGSRRIVVGGPNTLRPDATPRHGPTVTMGPIPLHEYVEHSLMFSHLCNSSLSWLGNLDYYLAGGVIKRLAKVKVKGTNAETETNKWMVIGIHSITRCWLVNICFRCSVFPVRSKTGGWEIMFSRKKVR
jgi:hypothetical protein